MHAQSHSPVDAFQKPAAAAQPEARRNVWTRWTRLALVGFGLYAAVVVSTGIYWSLQPAEFDVRAVALDQVGGDASKLTPGLVAVSTVRQVASNLLDKPGGFLHNDMSVPSIYLDNMPNWEYGVLKEVRDSLRAIRNDFSRSQTQSIENLDLRKADEFLNYDAESWILPSTESVFHDGIQALDRYLAALMDPEDRSARFFTRADNLAAYLAVVEKRLGSYGQRLSASVGDAELTAALVTGGETPAAGTPETLVRTPWLEVDDVFFEARGYAWALLHMFKAMAIEFEPVLRDKNAMVSVQQVIRDLERATVRRWSPFVFNGHGYGLLANHSLILASYLSRANTAVLDLRILLQQG
jgi:hypothetical protein